MKFKGKLMNLTWENSEKPNFGPDFCPFDPNLPPNFFSWVLLLLDVRHCHKLSSYAISKKTYDQKKEDGEKPHFRLDSKFWPSIFFSKIWLFESLDILVSYHHEQYQEKLMIHYWENLVTDGRTDRQRDRQTEESDFTGRCPTNVERPIVLNLKIFMITFVTSVDFLYQLLYEEKGRGSIYISDCICKYISATFVLWPILNRIPKQNKRKQSKIKAFLGNSCEIVFYTNRGINVEKLH